MLVTGHFGGSEAPLPVYVTSNADDMSYVPFTLTLSLLMSCVYIYIYMYGVF
jgi:hypothetical protein